MNLIDKCDPGTACLIILIAIFIGIMLVLFIPCMKEEFLEIRIQKLKRNFSDILNNLKAEDFEFRSKITSADIFHFGSSYGIDSEQNILSLDSSGNTKTMCDIEFEKIENICFKDDFDLFGFAYENKFIKNKQIEVEYSKLKKFKNEVEEYKNTDILSLPVYYLVVKIKNQELLDTFKKLNKYINFDFTLEEAMQRGFICDYRYNFFSLIDDAKPYSEDEQLKYVEFLKNKLKPIIMKN